MSFWEFVWFMLITFAFVAYLMVMFSIVADLFRDRDTSGWAKAAWIIALIFAPFLTALIYVIVRGRDMPRRQEEAERARAQAYLRAREPETSPTEQIAGAKSLLDAGTITPEEYDRRKQKALA
jgi:type VI protein secretion system component VasK